MTFVYIPRTNTCSLWVCTLCTSCLHLLSKLSEYDNIEQQVLQMLTHVGMAS